MWRNIYIWSSWVFSITALVDSVVEWFLPFSIRRRVFWAAYCFLCSLFFSLEFSLIPWVGRQACSIIVGLASVIYFLTIIKDWPEKEEAIVPKRDLPVDGHPKKARILLVFRIWR